MGDWYKVSTSPPSSKQQDDDLQFDSSRTTRSPVLCRHAAVATSQPLASSIGLDFLRQGANAAETAVAVAAALAVTEPCSTGLGGDMFCLYFDNNNNKKKTVSCINGSGKSPAALTLERIQQQHPASNVAGVDVDAFRDSPLSVTVPGAAAGWEAVLQKYGSSGQQFTLAQLVEPAAVLAEEGFPVAPVTARHWQNGMDQITKWLMINDDKESSDNDKKKIPLTNNNNEAPSAGDIVVNTDLARVLRDLGRDGAVGGFYQNPATGGAICDVVQKHGGCLTLDDLAAHTCEFPSPIAAEYRGCKLWQVPPNGQGIASLIALTGLKHLEEKHIVPAISPDNIGSADTYHAMIEMMRLGFADNRAHVADLEHVETGMVDRLLDAKRIGTRAEKLFDINQATIHGVPDASSCTVSFQVVDPQGNAISFVNSNFQGFGTGLVPKGCGFTLQNRGKGFTLDPANHPNCVAPCKRPYHTIIPGMLTHADDNEDGGNNELYATLSNMGGNMQPQGHLQLTVDMLAGNLDPQAAIDRPRFCIADGTQHGVVSLEEGVDPAVVEELKRRGHKLQSGVKGHARSLFGRAQIIRRDRKTGVLWAGSDGRADGCAIGF